MDEVPVNPADPHVIEVGRSAVEWHNKQPGTKLQLLFVAVVGGFKRPVTGGTLYALIIETQDGNGTTYLNKALVLQNPDGSLEVKKYWV